MAQDWEVTFNGWAKPPGKTEQDKCGNAETAIRKAIPPGDSISKRSIKPKLSGFEVEPHFMMQNILLKQ